LGSSRNLADEPTGMGLSPEDAYKVLGVPGGSIRGKPELEKVRQRSKELFKRYAAEKEEKSQRHAKRVLEAFEVIKNQFKKQASSSKAPVAPANGVAKVVAAKPPAVTASTASTAAAKIQRDLASLRSQFGDTAGKPSEGAISRHSSRDSVTGAVSRQSSRDSVTAKPASSSQVRRPENATVTKLKVSSDSASGTSSAIRQSASLLSLVGKPQLSIGGRPVGGNGSNGSKKRPTDDIPFLPNKKACVVVAMPAQMPVQSCPDTARLMCKCGANYGASRFQGATGAFVCPACRIRAMDPLNVVAKGSKGILILKLVQKPVVSEDAKLEANFKFKLDVSQIKEWRKLGDNVEARMVRLDNYDAFQDWPNSLTFKVNGREAFVIKEGQAGHKRRDLPRRIAANLKPGVNVVEVAMKDENVQRYAIALVRTTPLPPREMCKHVRCRAVEECKQRVKDLLFSSILEGCVEEFSCAGSDRSRLICPITLTKIRTPARGKKCKHLQCFDLEAYLMANQKMAVMNKRWLCPVCDMSTKPPGDLFIDTFLVQVLAETSEMAEEVAFDGDANWTVTAMREPASDDSEPEPADTPAKACEVADGGDLSDDECSDVAMAEDLSGNVDGSDVEALEPCAGSDVDVDAANGEDGDQDLELDDRPSSAPTGSPLEDNGNADSDAEAQEDIDATFDPYMMSTKDDDDVDEDFVATLRASPRDDEQASKSSRSYASIATPAPLASPILGSPGEASDQDPDDPLGVDKHLN